MPPDEKLIIETPEQTFLEFPLAGVGSRSLALAIDTLLQGGAGILLAIAAGIVSFAGFLPQMGKQWGYALLILVLFLVEFGYFAFFEAIWNGQTPGKRWIHLRVIQDSGRPIGVQQAILRNLLRIVDSLPVFYAAGIITSLISPQSKRLGDYLAGTVVVHEEPLTKDWLLWRARTASPLNTVQDVTLTASELQLVEAFLERRASFEPVVRSSMARQVAEKIGNRWSIPEEERKDSEKFLEGLVEKCRNGRRLE